MRLPLLVTLCAVSALAAGCDGENGVRISSSTTTSDAKGVLKVVDTLQCPETLGVLTRKGTAQAGGTVCNYSGPRGAEVSLHLVKLEDESADGVMRRFEALLSAAMPHTSAELRASADAAEARMAADGARVAADAARVEADAARIEADEARRAADASANGERVTVSGPGLTVNAQGEKADVRLPGLSVNADGDRASVQIGGFSINADDAGGTASINSSDDSVSIQAHEDAAEIRTRAPGEATRATYMLTDQTPAQEGWRLVGYEARGPVGGPIVVATVRAKDRDSDGVFDSAKDLVTLNVGE
ncbi:hypothetical protein [Brevundimonas subvibrioides]|uniref:Methyltransferase type 11 n=1 Tax=Brevundimonas subvibrioides (strain ATCC 15264 / DSM 4735 / LMG 14903 / NBRC 16000 / CB 81) TaxID=633149 RepID=D9QKQ5_BRESC|nr:hypothetical protein [Brevundimonas subvibrioides]ADL01719.1 conserved hypothetical protein [Brevundimonas subvibrioides ATCC 15264]